MLKLLDGAVARLLQCSFDNRLLYGRREFGDRSQVLPPARERTRQGLHEVTYSLRPATEVKQQVGCHHPPSRSRTAANCSVLIRDVEPHMLHPIYACSA